ncbi:TetR/AcrR family transcriptional regulator C-terminal domain-containing protein [Spirillospora sp. NPDC029432]|uniref:TetR/AcrR family transcriptional regulator C-terminal domain-containing protein n=1 Tax=Spirillospora sp. NPDC029432 TaxID=3154599 RepID=UPI003452CA8D
MSSTMFVDRTAESGGGAVGDASTELPVPPWRKPRKSGRSAAARRPLTRELIVEAALRVLDAEGLDAVTMRRVAQELGTGPASLYAHFANKDELLEEMLDLIAAEITLPEPDAARWQEQVKEVAREIREVWRGHRDIARASLGTIPTGPNQLRIAEGQLAIMRAGGVPPRIAALALDSLGLFIDADVIEGAMMGEKGATNEEAHANVAVYLDQVRQYFTALPAERYPNLVAMVDELMRAGDDERFEFGLDLFVRGIASHARGIVSG